MIQALDKTFKEVRTVFSTDNYSVLVCRDLSEKGLNYYTILHLKNRELQKRYLKMFSQQPMKSSATDFVDIVTVGSELAVIFNYYKENPLFYYQSLYCRQFEDRLDVAKDLLAELMASSLPLEIQYFMLEDYNINITPDKQVYFNYFIDIDVLPDEISLQDIVNKAARTVWRIISEGLKTSATEMELFRLKTERQAFHSFIDIYSALKKIPADIELNLSMWDKISRFYHKRKSRIFFITKLVIMVVLVLLSLFYSIREWRSRSIAASKTITEINSEYKGLEKIGTVVLVPEESSE